MRAERAERLKTKQRGWLLRWYRKRTNSYAYWTGYNEARIKFFDEGREWQRMVQSVIDELKRGEQV